jgi:serine protease AprX
MGALPQNETNPARAHEALLELAAAHPNERVSVIVQKNAYGSSAEVEVGRLGGTVTAELKMINAFAADLSASAAVELSRASGVRRVSPDARMHSDLCNRCIETTNLRGDSYTRTIGANRVWNNTQRVQGEGVTVAVIDSGIAAHRDLRQRQGRDAGPRVLASVRFNSATEETHDYFGHGTHVAGIIGGNGAASNGINIGVAPKVNLINLKVGDDQGVAHMSDVVAALEWVYEHRTEYNIRVVNMSLSSGIAEAHHLSPLDAAVELLWFNSVVVVVSAGNQQSGGGTGVLYPPANDPFVITVGATDDQGTSDPSDDRVAAFSSYGITQDLRFKPDLVAPGVDIVSLAPGPEGILYEQHPTHHEYGYYGAQSYFRMTGTSMSAPVVAGTVALLLQDEPYLTPDQVKYRLKDTARPVLGQGGGAGQLDAYAAVYGTSTRSANTGQLASLLILLNGVPLIWDSVSWNTVNWNTVNWSTVNWNTVNWNADFWGDPYKADR